jgi:two-component system chemotaxis response regulator CheY
MAKMILVVDDSSSIRQVVCEALKDAAYQVLQADDGQAGLRLMDGRKINLIISDLNMPNMDGLSFVTAVKQLSAYRFTPVIMFTTESSAQMRAAGRAAGVRAWLVKPFQPAVLLDAVAKLIAP